MEKTGTSTRQSDSGYASNITAYQAKRCHGCPLGGMCHQAKGDRIISVNHNLNHHRQQARQRLNSEEGLLHRSRRSIEPEAVFGQTGANKNYSRFRHFGGDKVKMDFAIFAVAFNIGKLHNKSQKNATKPKKSGVFVGKVYFFVLTADLWEPGCFDRTFPAQKMKMAA
jgi:hypothetical protein